jgi:hypothetical protein
MTPFLICYNSNIKLMLINLTIIIKILNNKVIHP